MPKIPTFTSEARLTAEPAGVAANIKVPMIDIAGDLQKTIAKYYIEEKKEEAKVKSLEYENDSWSGLYDILDKHKNNPYPSDAINNFNNDVQAYKQNYLNTKLANESKLTKDAWLQKFDANVGSATLSLNKITRDNLEKKKDVEDDRFSSTMSTRLRLDDIYSNKVDLDIENYVNSKYSDPNVQDLKRQGLIRIKEATIADKRARTDPFQFLADLSKNPNLYNNAPQSKERAIILAQSILAQNGNKLLQEKLSAAEKGQDIGVSNEAILSSFIGSKDYTMVAEELKIADSVKNYANNILNAEFDQGYKIASTLEITAVDPKLKPKIIKRLQSLSDNKQKLITKNGAAEFFIEYDNNVKSAYNDYLLDPSQTNFNLYSKLLDDKFDKQNIPEQYRTYLSSDQIKSIDDRIKGEPEPERKLAVIENLKLLYADKYPIIQNQLYNNIDQNILFAGNINNIPLKQALARGELNPEQKNSVEERFKIITGSLEDNIISEIQKNTDDFYKILLNQGQGRIDNPGLVMQPIENALKNATMQYLLSGRYSSVEDAISAVTNGFLEDYDLSNNNFFIPRDVNGKTVAVELIDAKASLIKGDIKYGRVDLNDFDVFNFGEGGEEISKEETINLIRSSGDWYLNGNKGLIFSINAPNGKYYPLLIKDPKNPNKKIPLTINFLEKDGVTSLVNNQGINYEVSYEDLNTFISAKDIYQLQQVVSP
jgi:hypothetical protein